MARKKNCDKRRQQNLPKLLPKAPAESRRPTIEDITDSESDDDDSECDMESDDEDNILKDVQTNSELLAFVSRL